MGGRARNVSDFVYEVVSKPEIVHSQRLSIVTAIVHPLGECALARTHSPSGLTYQVTGSDTFPDVKLIRCTGSKRRIALFPIVSDGSIRFHIRNLRSIGVCIPAAHSVPRE